MNSTAEVFSHDGVLAACISGYDFRPQQLAMANAVSDAINGGYTLVAEAGTGTGKTYAYLVPAILSGRKVIVSTGSRNLQDQLYFKDVPFIKNALGLPVRIVQLKGRGNYLCRYRLRNNTVYKRLRQPRELHELETVRQWEGKTLHGDIAELPAVAENSSIWSHITATADNCLGGECEDFSDCYLTRARRAAQAADIVIVNHHLFLADQALKDEGFGDLLPGADIVIFDEAHQLPETALNFFGVSVSSRQIRLMIKDSLEALTEAGLDADALAELAQNTESVIAAIRKPLGGNERRMAWSEISEPAKFEAQVMQLRELITGFCSALQPHLEQSKTLDRCCQRGRDLVRRLGLVGANLPADYIPWLDIHSGNFSLHGTPVSVAGDFQRIVDGVSKTWIFTSATLSAGGSFDHFIAALGLQEPVTESWESPFDFPQQALLYVPENMPMPNEQNYTQSLVTMALPVLQASRGRAFMLFTSYRALHEAQALLAGQPGFTLLVQGQASKMELLQRFVLEANAVLLGTASFWEGVDVRGQVLSCVIIDKLPFASPADPVNQGRFQEMNRRGENPFWQMQVPQAIIMLKQGVGRLIRDSSDTGVLMIGDPRLLSKSYGRKFLASLPPLPLTRKPGDVVDFFRQHAESDLN